jgi:TIR domain
MRVFISWSGGRSQRLAEVMRDWIEDCFSGHGISAFVSSDIDKGSPWLSAVNAELSRADAGLVCLTAQSLHSEWVLFEAGALSTAVARNTGESRVFTYLLGVEPRALRGPLSVYQSTVATMEDTLRLINSLLGYLGRSPMGADDFTAAWNRLWPRVQQIKNEPITSIVPDLAGLFRRKTFDEPVQECADQSWFQRYDSVLAARHELKAQNDLVAAEWDASLAELYRDLVADVDGYAMDIRAGLFEPKQWDRLDDGTVAVPPDVRTPLERRRRDIQRLVGVLLDPDRQPRLPGAVRFARSPAFVDRKGLVHWIEQRLAEPGDGLRNQVAGTLPRLLTSDWELDRIAAYLYGERRADGQDARDALAAARRELELVRAVRQPQLMPLHYSLRWARATGPYPDPRLAAGVRNLADAAAETIASKDLDPGGQVRELLADLRALATAG